MKIPELRSTIRELVVRYKLEPGLRDVFVEGSFDCKVIRWFLVSHGKKRIAVRPVGSVAITADELAVSGFTDGEKHRVIYLARTLADELPAGSTVATCVIDADLDRIVGLQYLYEPLLVTDYTCMEMYLFDTFHLQKFVTLVLGADDVDVSALTENLAAVLRELFLVRLVLYVMHLNIPWLDFTKCCALARGGFACDIGEYVRRVLDSGQKAEIYEQFVETMARCRCMLPCEPQMCANGHDFIQLLRWALRRAATSQALPNEDAVASALVACLEDRSFSYSLFSALLGRLSPTPAEQ